MTISDVITVVNGEIQNKIINDQEIKKIKIDSRKINEGDLFIAIRGDNHNGHDFIKEVISKKPSAIIVDEDTLIEDNKIPIIKVQNTFKTMGMIASYLRSKHQIPLIAVTGSVGKTTTKELIYNILSVKYNVLKNNKNNNNHIGVPLTLFNLNKEHNIIVTELGMNHAGEIKWLSKICKPDVAVITNIGTSHIGNLGSKKAIYKAKMEITDGMDKGVLIVNGDDAYLKKIKKNKKINIYKCGLNKKNDLCAYNIKCNTDNTTFHIKLDNQDYKVCFSIPGCHMINNILLAIKIGLLYDIDIKDIIEIVGKYKSVEKRMNIIRLKNNNILIEDCYNSSYESLIGVLKLIKKTPQNKVLILGDILELGKYSRKIHLKIGRYLKKIYNSKVILVGDHIKVIKKRDYHFNTNKGVIDYLKNNTINNSVILLKGSRKLKLEEIKAYLHKRY